MNVPSKLGLISLGAVFFIGCQPETQYPIEPVIEFESFVADGDKGVVTVSFTDGDGDIGLEEYETQPPYDTSSIYFNNLFIAYEEKVDGVWQPGLDADNNPIIFRFRIPNVTPEGQNKALKGKIEAKIEPIYYDPNSLDSDTIRLKVKIVDRALHWSNEVTSDDIHPW